MRGISRSTLPLTDGQTKRVEPNRVYEGQATPVDRVNAIWCLHSGTPRETILPERTILAIEHEASRALLKKVPCPSGTRQHRQAFHRCCQEFAQKAP
jgi:hypothetical protein